MGSMYAAVIFIGIQNSNAVQPVIAVERTVFYRERAAGMYSALPYAFAQASNIKNLLFSKFIVYIIHLCHFLSNLHVLLQVLIELPYVLVQAVVYGFIIYAMIGFEWTVTKVLWYLFFMFFTFLYFTYYGMMSVAMTPNQHISTIVASAFYSVWNLFSGFIVPRPVSFGFL